MTCRALLPKTCLARFLLALLLLAPLLLAGPLAAQQLDGPVIEDASDGQAANCAAGTVMGLDPRGDGFLALRSGPGAGYRQIGALTNGDRVTIFGGQDGWLAGAGLGWVHGRWVGDIIP